MVWVDVSGKKGAEVTNWEAVTEAMDRSWVTVQEIKTSKEVFEAIRTVWGDDARHIRYIDERMHGGTSRHRWNSDGKRWRCEWSGRYSC